MIILKVIQKKKSEHVSDSSNPLYFTYILYRNSHKSVLILTIFSCWENSLYFPPSTLKRIFHFLKIATIFIFFYFQKFFSSHENAFYENYASWYVIFIIIFFRDFKIPILIELCMYSHIHIFSLVNIVTFILIKKKKNSNEVIFVSRWN